MSDPDINLFRMMQDLQRYRKRSRWQRLKTWFKRLKIQFQDWWRWHVEGNHARVDI